MLISKVVKPSIRKLQPLRFKPNSVKYYLQAMRPRQWTKNLVVFAAPLFAFNFSSQTLLGSSLAIVLFCAVSSSFYLINDIVDVKSDRQHPVKSKRPIAAGLIPIPVAITLAAVLLLSSLSLSWFYQFGLGVAITSYATIQVAYNLKLKRTVILDIVAIALGFVFRAYGGAAAANITLSPWFLLCTAMLALFLGVEKRKAELRHSQAKLIKPRSVLQRYTPELLNRMESLVTTGTIMTYALWSAGPSLSGASTPWMMLTLPFVLSDRATRRGTFTGYTNSDYSAWLGVECCRDSLLQSTVLSWFAVTPAYKLIKALRLWTSKRPHVQQVLILAKIDLVRLPKSDKNNRRA
jgi:decaprenyl-phosphate phosphoribosyltransferase